MYVNAYYTTYDCNIMGTYCSYGDWFVEFSQLFSVVSQLFLTYFPKISFIFLTYFLSLLTYFFICHIVSQSLVSQVFWLIFIHNFAYSSHLLPDLLRLSSLKASVMILDSYDNSNV